MAEPIPFGLTFWNALDLDFASPGSMRFIPV
jgi:hypothetical protein